MTRRADEFHLFLVHSHITYLVARAVIDQRGLATEQVGFFALRGFLPPADGRFDAPLVGFDHDLVPRRRKQRPSMRRAREMLADVDRQLTRLTGGRRFHLYTPQTMEPNIQVLKNSRACAGFSFIEEGLHSYCTRAQIERSHSPRPARLWERLAYRNRVRNARFFDPGNCAAYGVHPAVFPDLHGRRVLDRAIVAIDPRLAAGVEHLLVFDSLASYRRIRLHSLLAVLQRLLDWLAASGVDRLHYKLHPAQVGTDEQRTVEALLNRAGLRVERLADALSLEGLARARPDTNWYVNLSSAGFYAALFGATVHSFAPWVAAQEPPFQRYIDLAPPVFSEYVRFL